MKKIFGILAFPVHHSLSPQMHNAGFLADKKNAIYTRFSIPPEFLSQFIEDNFRQTKKIAGLSVSVPHKETIIPLLDSIDETVKKIGAVNTVYWDEKNPQKLCGTNTDWCGFRDALLESYTPKGKTVLVLGAGGATRAIVYALEKLNPKKIYIWNRSSEKTTTLAKIFPVLECIDSPEKIFSHRDEIDLVINTTSLGMEGDYEDISPLKKEFWQSHHTAFDIVYTPLKTVFLKDCISAGGIGISGEKMLLFQGIEQYKIFTHNTEKNFPHKDIMKNAITPKEINWSMPKLSNDEKKNILQTIVKNTSSCLFESIEFWNQRLVKGEFRFSAKLREKKNSPHLIAEIKPASPSKGKIFAPEDTVESLAKMYEENGVSCISVLTDWKFFGAHKSNLQKAKKNVNLPLLRKDFILHEAQIFEARYLGADAVLLMRSVLSSEEIENFLAIARNLGMDCLVEVHDEEEMIDVLRNTSAEIIGVNTRDLKTMNINRENFSVLLKKAKHELGEKKFAQKIWVAESGIASSEDIKNFASESTAILVGTGILLSKDRIAKVRELAGE